PARPVNLYSHDDQQKAWMSGTALVANPEEGIGGRIADQVASLNGTTANPPRIPMLVSTAGINTFLRSDSTDPGIVPYQVGVGSFGRIQVTAGVSSCNTTATYYNDPANAAQPYCMLGGPVTLSSGYASNATIYNAFRTRVDVSFNPNNVYQKQWGGIMNASIKTAAAVNAAVANNALAEDTVRPFREYVPTGSAGVTAIDVVNPPNGDPAAGFNTLAAQLRMVATLIRSSNNLGATAPAQPLRRQIFFVSLGGFDTHGTEFWTSNPLLNKRIDRALDAFWQALGNIKVQGSTIKTARDQVTLFTMTDFGRTLDSNGQGSDHGWGSHHFVMGAAVKGGMIYGANHNVAVGDIPDDANVAGQKSRYMNVDTNAGAMPRFGFPPTGNETGAGQRARVLVPGTSTYMPLNHTLSRGELLPTMASDAYVATIARWFGVPAAQLSTVFPTLLTAHPTFNTTNGVGFMTIT
ncbi:MAG: DUF1501 domain-containing protein, partial [Casimicrobium sp.]